MPLTGRLGAFRPVGGCICCLPEALLCTFTSLLMFCDSKDRIVFNVLFLCLQLKDPNPHDDSARQVTSAMMRWVHLKKDVTPTYVSGYQHPSVSLGWAGCSQHSTLSHALEEEVVGEVTALSQPCRVLLTRLSSRHLLGMKGEMGFLLLWSSATTTPPFRAPGGHHWVWSGGYTWASQPWALSIFYFFFTYMT